jgi:Raf kinase inhibitor-like YbhB/YbcL family protein
MAVLGKLLRGVRAGERRGPLANLIAPQTVTVTSSAFVDGAAMPQFCAGKGEGANTSPALHWTGVPAAARQLVLIMDDVDVPLPRPLLHTVAVIDPTVDGVDAGELRPGTPGIRFIRSDLRHLGYAGPRPIPGHGPHRYRFHVVALDEPVADGVVKAKALIAAIRGHVLARGALTGTYERPGSRA